MNQSKKHKRNVFAALRSPAFHAILLLLSLIPVSAEATYDYTALIPPGWINAEATAINTGRSVVGTGSWNGTTSAGFLYESGTYTTLIPPGWESATAIGINDGGVVLGWCERNNSREAANFLYSKGAYAVLPFENARGINNNGDVVGLDGSAGQGFLYRAGTYTNILPPGWNSAGLYDINNNGDMVGWGADGEVVKGFLYSEGAYTTLIPPGYGRADARSSNSSGAAVGWAGWNPSNSQLHIGFLYSDGSYTELLPTGWSAAYAMDINDSGVVVGFGAEDVFDKGFVYIEGTYTEILPPGLDWAHALAINTDGAVIGFAAQNGGRVEGFLAVPSPVVPVPSPIPPPATVPVPAAAFLLGSGLVGIVSLRKKLKNGSLGRGFALFDQRGRLMGAHRVPPFCVLNG